jgi:site-specific DNA-methyltransferase (adenine-specific)
MTFTLHHGDCIKVMRGMADNSVDSIVTDPPYELGFMGKSWDSTGIAYSVEMWTEALRVLKPGGHLLAFSGSRTYHRMACAIEDAGFEIRDQIMWLYGSGFPKSHNVSKGIDKAVGAVREVVGTPAAQQWEGWGTALKPAHEPIVMARKPLAGTVANNVLQHGTGALNIDGSRVGAEGGCAGAGAGAGARVFGDGLNGSFAKPVEGLGRWPANVIHDGSDEVVDGFPDNGSAARFFYCAKANKRDRNEGLDGFAGKEIGGKGNGLARTCATCGASVLDGCQCPDRTFTNPTRANHHPTVKPTDLMRYLVKLITPPGGVVLDPFMGSGSTGKGAVIEGFNFVGIEQDADYLDIARARIQWALDQEVQLTIEEGGAA